MRSSLQPQELHSEVPQCSACGACGAICPTSSISMKEDMDGFLRPWINSDTCVGCKKCLQTCPVLYKTNKAQDEITLPHAYAAIHKNKEILTNSSSGGAFSALAQCIFNRKGRVYGAAYAEDMAIVHQGADNMDELSPLRGTKYAPSLAYTVFQEIKHLLKNGRCVLFTGLPCQVAGLKAYLGATLATSSELYTCDTICHGMVPSRLYTEYLSYLQRKHKGAKVSELSFRSKEKGIPGSKTKVIFNDGYIFNIPNSKDYYHMALVSDFCLRESCHKCQASTLPRAADMTIGDFWGLHKALPELNDSSGASVLFLHSKKAKDLLPELKEIMDLYQVHFQEAVRENPSFWISAERYPIREAFLKRLREGGYKGSVLHYFKRGLLKRTAYHTARVITRYVNNFFHSK